jgi:DNA-directed RNA polymerase specialized sigma24 family protein
MPRDAAQESIAVILRYVVVSGFRTTEWSLVNAAGARSPGGPSGPEAREALGELCRRYWQPIYALARRAGRSRDDAEDLIQGFIEKKIVERNALLGLQRERGRFRDWLKAAFENFMANDARSAHALKRGGGFTLVSIDAMNTEERHNLASDHLTPEQAYLRRWACAVGEHALGELRNSYEADGRLDWFEQLKGFLDGSNENYAELAAELAVQPSTLRKRVHEMRNRFDALLRVEVERTVDRRVDVDDELRALASSLAGCRRGRPEADG